MNQEFPWVPHLVHTWPRWAQRDTCSGIPVLPAGPRIVPAVRTHLHYTNQHYIITTEPQKKIFARDTWVVQNMPQVVLNAKLYKDGEI